MSPIPAFARPQNDAGPWSRHHVRARGFRHRRRPCLRRHRGAARSRPRRRRSKSDAVVEPLQISDGDIFISEIHYDNAGADTGEAIEVQAPVGTDLTDWTLVLYNGNGGASYRTDALPGVVGDAGVVVVQYPVDGVQNGSPDAVALVDDAGVVVELLSYEGVLSAVGGPADGIASTDIGVSEASTTPVGQSLQRIDGVWTGPAAIELRRAELRRRPGPRPGRDGDDR